MNFFNSESPQKYINPFFILILLLLTSLSFDIKSKIYSDFKGFFLEINHFMVILTFFIGTVFVFINKKRINHIVESDSIDFKNEKVKKQEFNVKFGKLKRVPLVNKIFRFIYRQGWAFSLVYFIIIIISFFLLSYNLDTKDLYEDEYQVVAAAEGHFRSGTYYRWDYLNNELSENLYDRAWPHTWMISQSYKLFGISEWSSRIISVLFGVFFVITFYFIAHYFTRNKLVASLAIFCSVLHPEIIRLFRYARMYAVFIPFFSLLFFCLYRFITEENRYDFKSATPFISKNINYNYYFLIPCLFLLIFNYLIHINSLIILPITYLFLLVLSNFLQTRKYVIPSVIGTFIIVAVSLIDNGSLINQFRKYLTFFEMKNFDYLDYLTNYPFNHMFTLAIFLSGLPLFFILRDKATKTKILYLYITVAFSLVFFIFIANRYPALKYISHVLPITIMLCIYITIIFIRVFDKKWVTAIFTLLWICGALNFSNRYFEKNFGNLHLSLGNPSIAYSALIESYDPEKEVIFGQYLRDYYLKDIGGKANIISMLNYKKYKFNKFWEDINQYEAGWIVFESRKARHIDNKILKYIHLFFNKIHGTGLDKTNIEMYKFDREMIRESIRYLESRSQAK